MEFPWYDLINNSEELHQGDIIKNCPIIRLPESVKELRDGIDIVIENYNVIIMTQSCDLANKKVSNILVCPFMPFREYVRKAHPDGPNTGQVEKAFKSVRDGLQPNYHMLNKDVKFGVEDYLVVDFKHVFAVHFNMLISHINETIDVDRVRLLSPYREQLSQAFARFFMRVGLPQNIPSIKGSEYT